VAGLLILACMLTLGALTLPGVVKAASPAATPGPAGGDTRTPGEGAGLVGSPILVALGVIALGALVAGGTTLYVRFTDDRHVQAEARAASGDRPAGTGSAGGSDRAQPDAS
jgi:hypothetical protein